MKAQVWLSKATMLLALALLIYFPIEVVLLLQQHQLPEPKSPVFFQYLLLSSLYILTLVLSIWIIYRKRFAWLGAYLYLSIPVLFFRSGARWNIIQAWEQTDFINSVWVKSYYGTTIWLSLVTILFFIWLYQQYSYRLTELTPWTKRLALLAVVLVIPADFVGFNYTFMVWAPAAYMFSPTAIAQIGILLSPIPYLMVVLLALWCIYNQRFYVLPVPTIILTYYAFFRPISAMSTLYHANEAAGSLARASYVSGGTILASFLIVALIFFIWFYENRKSY